MGRLFEFLRQNPILLFVAIAWIAGMIGNIGRMRKQRQNRTPARQPAPEPLRRSEPNAPPASSGPSAEQIAAEMRRILREAEQRSAPAAEAPRPAPVVQRNRVEPERAPVPVVPTTQTRKLTTHVDPHVGEQLAQRHVKTTGPSRELGSLGGRSQQRAVQHEEQKRFALKDLKRAFVLSEILGPPLARRSQQGMGS
ncbi:MAG: hypothetical protein JNL12_11315 [Planctomycetes bacterium]|nr:hypothetical protein [Planctomycetota bacterium]